jgi:hypothetical protein
MHRCRLGMWIIPLLGVLQLTGAALAQSQDDEEQGAMNEELIHANSDTAALAQSADDGEQGPDHQAPGVHVWNDRLPSKVELQSVIIQAQSHAKNLAPSVSDAPDFQNGNAKLWIGRLPKPDALRNIPRSGCGGC